MFLDFMLHFIRTATQRIQHIVAQMLRNVRQRDHYHSIPNDVMDKEGKFKANNFTDDTRIIVLSTETYHKNSFINLLLNRRELSLDSEEDNVQIHQKDNFLIYNVPGLYDIHPGKTEELKQSVKGYFQKHNGIFHAVFLLYVTPINWTDEDQDLVQFAKTLFGDNIIQTNGSLIVADYIDDLVPSFEEYIEEKTEKYQNNEVSLNGSLRAFGLGKFFYDVTKERCISVEWLKKDKDQVVTLLENTNANPTFTLKVDRKKLSFLEKCKEYKFVMIGSICLMLVIAIILMGFKFGGIYDNDKLREDTSSQMPDSETSSS